jgi:hypothetical protein
VRAAGRWYPRYLALLGTLTIPLVLLNEVGLPAGHLRIYAEVAWASAWCFLAWWAESHTVRPRGGMRRSMVALAMWAVGYLVVLGPLVRWRGGDSAAWWVVAAVVMAAPFFVAARHERRQT